MKRPIYFDTETTGVRFDKDRIIEIAGFDPVLNRTFSQLVNPKCPIPKEATAIHGITDEMVKDAPTFKEAGQQFIDFCEGDIVIVAHNYDAFDALFLKEECKRHQLPLPSWPSVDTLKWARKYRPDLPRHALQFLRQIFGISENNAHRALDDVVMLYQIFSIMIDDLSFETILELMKQASSSSSSLQHMPFGKYQGKPLSQVPKDYIQWLFTNGALEKPENGELKSAFERLGLLTG